MKNKKKVSKKRGKVSLWHKIVDFVKRELEMSLALLLMLGFVVGFSYASTSLEPGDVEITSSTSWDNQEFVIKGVKYNGLNFSAGQVSGLYSVRSGWTPSDLSQTTSGTKGQTTGQTYAVTITLDQAVAGTFYLHGSFTGASVNGIAVNSPLGPIALSGSSSITIKVQGGDTISKLVNYTGTDSSYTPPAIATLYLVPTTAKVAVGQTRSFSVIALDSTGKEIQNVSKTWSIVSGGGNATINKATGQITGVKKGVVQVQVKANGASAVATISVEEASKATTTTAKEDEDYPGADEDIDETISYPGADEDDKPTAGRIENTTTTQESVSETLDAFAEAQAEETATTGKSILSEQQVQAILNTTTTNTFQRAIAKVTLGMSQVAKDVKEILVGSTTTLDDGTVVRKESVFEKIGQFVIDLFVTGKTQDDAGVGASPMNSGLGEEEELE